ncbi:MAG: flagellar biosynthetic protein FliR [Thermoguttaceae bacterium]|jgi:flagellar biosynthetic protein FliR
MDWLGQLDAGKLILFTLVLTRTSGLLVTAPVFGAAEAPATVRALLAFTLAVLVMPTQWHAAYALPAGLPDFALLVGAELLLGLSLGLGLAVFLSGIQMAGELISRIGGLTLSDVLDPTSGEPVPLISRLLALVSTAMFMAIGGHRCVMAGLLDTFATIPPGGMLAAVLGPGPAEGGPLLPALARTFTMLVTQSFHLGLRASIPVVAAVLLATLVLGLIGRTLPQLNVLVLGFGLNAMITFGVLGLSLGAALFAFRQQIEPTLQLLIEMLGATARPL